MRVDLAPMRTFPDLALPDHGGVVRSLSELAGGDPLVVHFYRGWFCPKERAWSPELLALGERAEVAYTGVVSISVDPPDVQAALRAGMGARWPLNRHGFGAASFLVQEGCCHGETIRSRGQGSGGAHGPGPCR